jgi:hypothetical protein
MAPMPGRSWWLLLAVAGLCALAWIAWPAPGDEGPVVVVDDTTPPGARRGPRLRTTQPRARRAGHEAGAEAAAARDGEEAALAREEAAHAAEAAEALANIEKRTCRWTGVVKNADGVPATGAVKVEIRDAAGTTRITIGCDAKGRFDARLPEGHYRVTVAQPESTHEVPGTVRCVAETLEQDLVLPGARVHGAVRGAVTRELLEDPGAQGIWLQARGGPRRFLRFGKGGAYALDGIAPGVYAVKGWPKAVRTDRGEDPVLDVRPGDATIRLDLEVIPD